MKDTKSLAFTLTPAVCPLTPSSQPKTGYETSKKDPSQTSPLGTPRDINLVPTRQEVEAEKQAALNKGMLPPILA